MVKKKGETSNKNWLVEEVERARKRLGEPIAKRYYVVEVTPAQRYLTGDGHGGSDWKWSSPESVRVSPYFTTPEDRNEWMDQHEPDEGKSLQSKVDTLYRRVVEEWH